MYPASGYTLLGSGATSRTNASKHVIGANVTSIQLTYPGYYINQPQGFIEQPAISNMTITATIEYNGVFNRIKFSGSNNGNLPAGQILQSDFLPISIPKGATVRIWTHVIVPSGGNFSGGLPLIAANGEGVCPTGTDYTGSGTASLSDGIGFTPIGISGETSDTTVVSVCDVGDSIHWGANDANTRSYMTRALDALQVGYSNFAIRGLAALDFKNVDYMPGIWKCIELLNFTHAISDIGGANDLNGSSGTAEAVFENTLAVGRNLRFRGIAFIAQCTITPLGISSSDGWSTANGQTMRGNNSYRPSYHAMLKSSSQINAVLDAAGAVSIDANGRLNVDGAYWKPNYTDDGIHPIVHQTIADNPTFKSQLAAFLAQTVTPPVSIPIKTIFRL